MGRTLPSADQRALTQLLDFAQRNIAEVAAKKIHVGAAAHPLPLEMFIRSMLLEVHKEVIRLRLEIERRQGSSSDIENSDGCLF